VIKKGDVDVTALNYTLNFVNTNKFTITARPITVTATPGAAKVYDGLTDATVTTSTTIPVTANVVLSDNRVSGDVVTVSWTDADYNNANAGTTRIITVSGLSISGDDAGNYSLASTTAATTATAVIVPAELCASYTGLMFVNTNTTKEYVANDGKIRLSIAIDNPPSDIKSQVESGLTKVTFSYIRGTSPSVTINPIIKVSYDEDLSTSARAIFYFDWTPPTQAIASTSTIYSETYDIKWVISGNYANTSNCPENESQITFSVPTSDFVTGGGYIIPKNTDVTTGANQGRKNNFGFSMKYNNKMTNLQGNFNTQIRRGTKFYHVKSNTPQSITITSKTAPYAATLVYQNVVIQEIVDGVVVWSQGGNNVTLEVKDNGEGNNAAPDEIGITVKDKTGKIWYANNLESGKPAKQPLNGGNIQVRLGTVTQPTQQVVTEARAAEVIEPVTRAFQLKAFPNPSTAYFNVQVESDNVKEKINVRVMDLYGRTIEVVNNVISGQTIKLGGAYRPGIYFVEMIQGNRRQQVKLLKQGD
jgi:hypothetical protein